MLYDRLLDKSEFEKGVNVMQVSKNQYVFPAQERKIFTKAGLIMLPLELIVHLMFIIPSITHRNLDGVWVSLFFAIIFSLISVLYPLTADIQNKASAQA